MDKRMNPNLVWALAGLAVGLSLVAAKLLHVPPKVFAAVYFVLFAGLGTVSTLFTDAKRSTAGIAFATAAAIFGVVVYLIIQHALAAAGAQLGASSAGAALGKSFGMIWGIAYFLDALAAGITGVIFGRKLQKGLGSVRVTASR